MDADVAVIGAGAAGLSAALALARRSLRVIVFEARDRVGGRAWSVPSHYASVPAELGAEFIHGQAHETMALLREAGSAAVDADGEPWILGSDGKLQSDSLDFQRAAGLFEAARSHPDQTVEQFLRRYAGTEEMRDLIKQAQLFVEGFDAADASIASARGIAEELHAGVDFASSRPIGGYRSLFDYLHGLVVRCGVALHLSTEVRKISWQHGVVELETAGQTGVGRRVSAHAAVITVPLGVLKQSDDEARLTFEPQLPPAKHEALEYLEMGHVVKVVLFFEKAFWERLDGGRYRNAGFFRGPEHPFPTYWTQYPVRSDHIVAWAGGPKAAALRGHSSDALIGRALHGFGGLFSESAAAQKHCVGGLVHDWDGDPFARGAYSYAAVGAGDARASLAEPVDGTLFFAGEATATRGRGGTVDGALHSGDRAAAQAIEVLESVRR